mmetsp:Transcript_21449/g.69452  ORF Transcript_21449/g.69452 Transcript_21449/m.69452 type:complete len:437 (-) Transcript_21449:241-1551(-)
MDQSFPLAAGAELAARLTWGAGSGGADADLQAVIVDRGGRIVDAVYYNNVRACGGRAAVHTGDEGGRAGAGGREEVRFALGELSAEVHMILILACSFTAGATLRDAPGANLTVESLGPDAGRLWDAQVDLPFAGYLAALVARRQSGWEFRIIGEPLQEARHFMDCLPELNKHIVAEIPTANRRQKIAFAMEKGSNLDLGASQQSIVLGLGWDVDQGKVDLDASAILLDAQGSVLESMFFGNLRSSGAHSAPGAVEHSGDNLTGEGEGDDEQILVDLKRIGGKILQVVFCVNIYTQRKTFAQVSNPFCRVVDSSSGAELCRYALRDAGSDNGLIIARIARETGGRWGFHALGLPSRGSMYKDSLPQIRQACQLKTATLVERSQSRSTLGDDLKAPGSWAVLRQPRPTWRRSLVKAALHLIGCSGKVAPETPKSRLTK